MDRIKRIVMSVASAALALPAAAGTVTWTDWTSVTGTNPNYTATGSIGPVTATYTGGLVGWQLGPGGTNYWNPSTPYISGTVSNAPTTTDILRYHTTAGTISFSQPVTNPVMAIVSLGQPGVGTSWNFSGSPNIVLLSQGVGYWGGSGSAMSVTNGQIVMANEGHGTIQFVGTFSSISWTVSNGENWTGMTVGLLDSTIPLPSAGAMSLAGLGILGVRRRRN